MIRHFLLAMLMTLTGCGKSSSPQPNVLQLQVISPHGSDIRREFADAFSDWHLKHFGQRVEILWPDIGGGGTGNIIRQLDAAYSHAGTSGYDVIFGGGSAAFNSFAGKGFLVKVPAMSREEMEKSGWKSDPVDGVPADIFASPLHAKDGAWVAAAMSSFGMEINKDRIAELGMKVPRAWGDIATPEWFGRLSLADPSKSGSVKTSYEMILQQYGKEPDGWAKGWAVLTRLFENASLIRDSGSAPADDVGSADAMAGIVIDFYGRLQVLRAGENVAGFVVPEGGTALDADPIAMLKGSQRSELAARFIRFVVSPEGQKLWVLRVGTPGGPRKTALGRMCVVPEVYKTEKENLFDPMDPFDAAAMLKTNPVTAAARNPFLGDLIKAALIDNHEALVRARRAVKRAGDPPELLAMLEGLPTYKASDVKDNKLTYGDSTLLDEKDLAVVAGEYGPPKDSPKAPYTERLQNGLKDLWRETFAQRFAEVETAARHFVASERR
ncbi:MAG TPA: extracellular solute-binding protein [Phycisphaerae bacterium]